MCVLALSVLMYVLVRCVFCECKVGGVCSSSVLWWVRLWCLCRVRLDEANVFSFWAEFVWLFCYRTMLARFVWVVGFVDIHCSVLSILRGSRFYTDH